MQISALAKQRLLSRPTTTGYKKFEQYRDDPIAFTREVLGIEPWARQEEILRAALLENSIAVRSGQKVSKALALDTPIPTPEGWTTMGELQPGDTVFDDQGKPCRVTGVSDVFQDHECFDVVFSDGTIITADAGHEWVTWKCVDPSSDSLRSGVCTTSAIARTLDHRHTVRSRDPSQGGKRVGWVITEVRPRPSVPVRCITVDSPSHQFLCSRAFIPTHNSCSAICVALWFAVTRRKGRVILTAPTHRQIRAILWRELKDLYIHAKQPLGGELHDLPEIGLKWDDGREIVGFYTTEPEKMAGLSGANLLFIVDEASGIPKQIFEAIEGNRAGGAKLLMFSNPTQTSGVFFDAFHTKRAFWKCIHISSEEAAETGIPGLATKSYIAQRKAEWGVDHVFYQVRVEGNFPNQQSNAVVALADAEAAVGRYGDAKGEGPLYLGIDPARFGDDATIIFPRRGWLAMPLVKVVGQDTQQVGARAIDTIRALRHSVHERAIVRVDVVGLGAGVADYLREYARRGEIVLQEVSAAAKARNEKRYQDARAELWFTCAAWLANGGAIPDDSELLAELTTPVYDFDPRTNRLRVQQKDEIKKALGRSPDKADALCLAVYDAPLARFSAAMVPSRYKE